MIVELGHLALWLALVLAVLQAVIPLYGHFTARPSLLAFAAPATLTTFLLLSWALLALGYAFYSHDFSLSYVAGHSNSALPLGYRLSAVWGGHEGSLLLWCWMLGLWAFAVSVFRARVPAEVIALVLAVIGIISVGFLSFMLFTSNPFDRNLPWFPLDGGDLNPLLQDPGLIIHPPMLYMGYVGFSVAFAFAIAGLLRGQLDPAWARWARPWTTVAWCFLTLGIALGSWWAYYELGWGGWWFWDPVENASLMPWLAGTALIHSLAVTEKRGLFRAWTVLLAILAFSLCLLGTFLVRSGVLTSVHSFANDPARGAFVLIFLCLVVGASLTLYAMRAGVLSYRARFEWFSRETFLLGNNLLLFVATFVVLTGTLFPLLGEALDIQISVRSPYFNGFTVPLTLVLLAILVPGVLSNWKKQQPRELLPKMAGALAFAIVGTAVWITRQGTLDAAGTLAILLATLLIVAHLWDVLTRAKAFRVGLLGGLRKLRPAYYGMVLAHIGLAVLVMGITEVSQHDIERDVRMKVGDSASLNRYQVTLDSFEDIAGPNYDAVRGNFSLTLDGQLIAHLIPEKRTYRVGEQVMTEASIHSTPQRDVYIALGEPLSEDSWAVRLYYKPGIAGLWLGALLMALGGFLAISDRRYRQREQEKPDAA